MFGEVAVSAGLFALQCYSAMTAIGEPDSELSVLMKILSANSIVLGGLKSVPWWTPLTPSGLLEYMGSIGAGSSGSGASSTDCASGLAETASSNSFAELLAIEVAMISVPFYCAVILTLVCTIRGKKLFRVASVRLSEEELDRMRLDGADDAGRLGGSSERWIVFTETWTLSWHLAMYQWLPLMALAILKCIPCYDVDSVHQHLEDRMIWALDVKCFRCAHALVNSVVSRCAVYSQITSLRYKSIPLTMLWVAAVNIG